MSDDIRADIATICLVMWKYSDGDGGGAVRACESRRDAEYLLQLLTAHGDSYKEFYLLDVEFFLARDSHLRWVLTPDPPDF